MHFQQVWFLGQLEFQASSSSNSDDWRSEEEFYVNQFQKETEEDRFYHCSSFSALISEY